MTSMKATQITLLLLLLLASARAQDCGLSEVLKVAFYEKAVYDKVFIDYQGIGTSRFVLQKGKYAFIFPDSIFTQCYPKVHEDLAWSWPTHHLMHTIPYVTNTSGIVFITYYMDKNIPFNIIFDEIRILEKEARLRFRTSCDCQELTPGTIHRFDIALVRDGQQWKISKLESKTQTGCTWTYPGVIRKENVIELRKN